MAIEGQGLSVSIGLADRALARFSDEVEADPDQAVADLSAFLLKIAAQSFHGRVSKTQAMTIGGRDANGDDVCNAVTLAILEAFDQTPVNDPHLFLRWHDQADARVLQKASQMLARGRSMPLLVGDDPTIAGFVRVGIKPQDAADYCIIGCNELGIPGRAWETGCSLGGGLNYLRLLEQTLLTHAPDVHSMDDLWQRLRVALTNQLDPVVQSRDRIQRRYADKVPAPLTTALMTASEARCVDLMCDMPYRQRGFFERGLSDAANALMSIEQHVFIDQSISLPDLLQAMRDNWAGEAATVRDTMTCAPRWGNDVPAVDAFALRLIALRQEVLEQIEARDAVRFTPCHVVRSLHHLDGRSIGATPDGRFAGQMVGDSVGGICGTMNEGPTAMLNSVLKIDAARYYAGGYNLNLTLPGGLCDERIIAALISGFFQARGQELQVNVLDTAKLRAARANPDAYRDLVVRMAGLSARFIELSTLEQDELIARAEAAVR
jgi:formate C-acetyltransferase